MARIYQTRAWHDQLSPSVDEMEILALEAYAHLPADFRALTGEIVIQIAEFPTEDKAGADDGDREKDHRPHAESGGQVRARPQG